MTYGCKRGRDQISTQSFYAKAYRIAESLIEIGNSGEGRKILRGKVVDSYQVWGDSGTTKWSYLIGSWNVEWREIRRGVRARNEDGGILEGIAEARKLCQNMTGDIFMKRKRELRRDPSWGIYI